MMQTAAMKNERKRESRTLLHLREWRGKSEAFLAAGVNWSDSREPVVGFVRYATDKVCEPKAA